MKSATSYLVREEEIRAFAQRLRIQSLRMTNRAHSSHIGSCLSIADILAVLYADVLRVDAKRPQWPDRDRLIVSKGHAAAVTYAALAEAGFIPFQRLLDFGQNGGSLCGHVTHTEVPGVECSTGSLGHGLPVATGMALVAKRDLLPWRVFAILSDGECDEGSTWEAILFAAHHRLDNLVAVIDYNHLQSLDSVERTLGLEPLAGKFKAFGWGTVEVDGHDVHSLRDVLGGVPVEHGKPTAVVAHTVKGKGVSFMEGEVLWHYRPPTDDELARALDELSGNPDSTGALRRDSTKLRTDR